MANVERYNDPNDYDLEDRGYDYDDDTSPQYSDDETETPAKESESPSLPPGVDVALTKSWPTRI